MANTYVKRYRMEARIDRAIKPLRLGPGYRLVPWSPLRLQAHSEVKFLSFQGEIDANLFRCLSDIEGCLRLMREISAKPNFLPESTWLVIHQGLRRTTEHCGTIQGLRVTPRHGGIQNVGVTPGHRGRGLGQALVLAALLGFRAAGLSRAYLEVTAENRDAVRLYQRLGFRRVKIIYKSVDLVYS